MKRGKKMGFSKAYVTKFKQINNTYNVIVY